MLSRLTEDELKQADFDAYLGSDDDGEEEGPGGEDDKDPQKIRDRYRCGPEAGDEGEGKDAEKVRGCYRWGPGARLEIQGKAGRQGPADDQGPLHVRVKGKAGS